MNLIQGSCQGFVNFYAGTGNNPHAAGPCWVIIEEDNQNYVDKILLLSESNYGVPTILWKPTDNKTVANLISLGPPEGDPYNIQPAIVDSINEVTGEITCDYFTANSLLGGNAIIIYTVNPQGDLDKIAICDVDQGPVKLLITVMPQIPESTWLETNLNGLKVASIT